jgi:quinol monooxygenase YgiN
LSNPLVYVDRSEVRAGKLEELRRAIAELAVFVAANEPQLVSYAAFLDADGEHLMIVHVHRDAASLERHFAVAGPRFAPFAELVRLERMDVYGNPSPGTVVSLREKAAALGGATIAIHPYHAGFIR